MLGLEVMGQCRPKIWNMALSMQRREFSSLVAPTLAHLGNVDLDSVLGGSNTFHVRVFARAPTAELRSVS